MTTRDYEGRIAELEHALEDVLECFEPAGTEDYIECFDPDGEGDIVIMRASDDMCEAVATAREVLYGGAADAEEA